MSAFLGSFLIGLFVGLAFAECLIYIHMIGIDGLYNDLIKLIVLGKETGLWDRTKIVNIRIL